MTSLQFNQLSVEKTYSRKEILSYLQGSEGSLSNNSLSWVLKNELSANRLHHLGRNRYSINSNLLKNEYRYTLSKLAEKILKRVKSSFPLIPIQIWETRQYNEFLNHQIGMNTIFLEIEKMYIDSVFDILDRISNINILVQPKIADFIRYQKENTIVLIRSTTESPVLKKNPNLSSLEKLLVDLKANKYLQSIISPNEIGDVFSQAYAQYSVSTSTLRRYAMRRTAWEKLNEYLPTEENIQK